MNWSLLISLSALLVSVLSPTLTALVNNAHSAKQERIRFRQEHQFAAISNYLRAAGIVCGYWIPENMSVYLSCCGEMYFYTPEKLWHFIDEISSALLEKNTRAAQTWLLEFGKELSKAGLSPKP